MARVTEVRIQDSPIAGFQYYAGELVRDRLRIGDALELRRAPANPYDRRAVEVWWHGHQLGHLPRVENHTVAQMLDRGMPLHARIVSLQDDPDPWKRVRFDIHLSTHA
ncbi:MAG: HIRAN domain-containing protein [Gammaproteobacteria bacterium]|nr:HIRAN domain-containing protein [Gammaproteobacteria bacterium]MCP5135261.1 HIRAN domain-containing protein [Gammaproteobacteria bacterium]